MNLSDIQNNLAPVNFILVKNKKDIRIIGGEHNDYYFPENEKHSNDCVKWLGETVKCNKNKKIIIYTFNDLFINTLGIWISLKKLPVDYVKVFIIENNEVIVSHFSEDGVLENWPFGWFMPDTDDMNNFNFEG